MFIVVDSGDLVKQKKAQPQRYIHVYLLMCQEGDTFTNLLHFVCKHFEQAAPAASSCYVLVSHSQHAMAAAWL